MPTNFYMIFIAAVIPMIVGAAYYSPMIMGKSWMKVNGFMEEDLEGGNMLAIFGGAYLLSVVVDAERGTHLPARHSYCTNTVATAQYPFALGVCFGEMTSSSLPSRSSFLPIRPPDDPGTCAHWRQSQRWQPSFEARPPHRSIERFR